MPQKITKIQDMALKNARPDHRAVRCRRRPHPGGRGGARRLWRGVPAQRARLGRHPADLGRSWAPAPAATSIRRPMTDFIFMVPRFELHVRHRSRRGEDGHQRDGDGGGAGRRLRSRPQSSIADGAYDNDIEALLADAPAHRPPADEQPRGAAGDRRRFDDRPTGWRCRSTRSCPTIRTSPTTSRN